MTDLTNYARSGTCPNTERRDLSNEVSPHIWSSPADMGWRAGRFVRAQLDLLPSDIRRAWMGRGYSVNIDVRGSGKFNVVIDYKDNGCVWPRFANN